MTGLFVVHLVLVALGGAIGGIARYWLTGLVERRLGGGFPWGTLAVNVTGAAAIGIVAGLSPEPRETGIVLPLWGFVVIGVLGSYTTVSSFTLQTLVLARSGQVGRAAGNVALSMTLCLAAAMAAFVLARG